MHHDADNSRLQPPADAPDWNTRYLQGDIPWDQHSTTHVLDRVIREFSVKPCRVLELGCGTGRNAIHLARLGFDVTAVDLVPRAIDLARENARQAGVNVRFHAADFRHLPDRGEPFPFVLDCGFYHCVRREMLGELLAFLESVTKPGSLWLTLTGNANDPQPGAKGPPRLRASELCAELESLFAVVELRETRFEAVEPHAECHPLAWSGLLRRR